MEAYVIVHQPHIKVGIDEEEDCIYPSVLHSIYPTVFTLNIIIIRLFYTQYCIYPAVFTLFMVFIQLFLRSILYLSVFTHNVVS